MVNQSSNFRLKFIIEGIPELSRVFKTLSNRLSDFREPLEKSAQLVLTDVDYNFSTEGSLSGGWQPLARSTVKGRLREGFGGEHPILQRTGRLRGSFSSRVTATKAVITSDSPYFVYHQSRQPRTKIPRRAMLLLTERTKQNIVQEFHSFLRFNTL